MDTTICDPQADEIDLRMEYGSEVGLAQKLALEKQLLEEEKFIVESLLALKAECNAIQIERLHLISMLEKEMWKGQPAPANETPMQATATSQKAALSKSQPTQMPNLAPLSLAEEFNLPLLDDVPQNEVGLNLTVPQHPFYGSDQEEEFDELESEDDYEIEMNMLMNGRDSHISK